MRITGVDADFLNVYYYKVTGTTGSPILSESGEGLETWYTEELGGLIKDIQSNLVIHTNILVESMENWATEFINVPISPVLAGGIVGPYAPTSVAWSFLYGRTLRTTRNGRKSFVGVPETVTDGNQPFPSFLPTLNNVAVALGSGWTIGNPDGSGWSMSPVIAKSPVAPATLPTIYNDVTGVSYRGIGTQNTRKRL